MKKQKWTHEDRICLVLESLAEKGKTEFSESDLTVEAWKMYPMYYGLKGYEEEFPDHKSVCMTYMKSTGGPVGKGYMENIGQTRYRSLAAGLARAADLQGKSGASDSEFLLLDYHMFILLKRALKSRAVKSFISEGKMPNDWGAASGFYGVSTPAHRMGMAGSEKKGKTESNTNNGAMNNLRVGILSCLDSEKDAFATTAGGGGGKQLKPFTRTEIKYVADVYNLLIEQWEDTLTLVGVKNPRELLINYEEK